MHRHRRLGARVGGVDDGRVHASGARRGQRRAHRHRRHDLAAPPRPRRPRPSQPAPRVDPGRHALGVAERHAANAGAPPAPPRRRSAASRRGGRRRPAGWSADRRACRARGGRPARRRPSACRRRSRTASAPAPSTIWRAMKFEPATFRRTGWPVACSWRRASSLITSAEARRHRDDEGRRLGGGRTGQRQQDGERARARVGTVHRLLQNSMIHVDMPSDSPRYLPAGAGGRPRRAVPCTRPGRTARR